MPRIACWALVLLTLAACTPRAPDTERTPEPQASTGTHRETAQRA